jgi:hypothetical protein
LITKNPDVPRDQSAKRIEREMANRRFHTAPVQFLYDPRAPLVAKTFSGQIPSATNRGRDDEDNRNP